MNDSSRALLAVAAVSIFAASDAALAQAGGTRGVTVQGIAFDSLRRLPLADAFVSIVGTSRSTTSDSRGRFVFDNVAPGTLTFAMQHAFLDTIGLPGVTARASVTDGQERVTLSVPAFETFWRAVCGAGPVPKDSGFVYGTIRETTTRNAVPSAKVDLTWVDTGVDKKTKTILQKRWHNTAASDKNGGYEICGAPANTALHVQAAADSSVSGVIDLPVTGLRVQRRDLYISPAAVAGKAQQGVVAGQLTDGAGGPLRGAHVVIDDLPEVVADDEGHFTVRNVPAGTRQVEVTSLGRLPLVSAVDVLPGETANFTAELRKATMLDKVLVSGSLARQHFQLELDDRIKTGQGSVRDSTELKGVGTLSSAFANLPYLIINHVKGYGSKITLMLHTSGIGPCTARLFVDGSRQADYERLNTMNPDELAMIELYPYKTNVPPRFEGGMLDQCGVVAVWTKRYVNR